MAETLYKCLIEEETEDESFIQIYWSRAEHMGVAIENVVAAALGNGLIAPEPKEIDPFDIDNLSSDVSPSSDAEVFWAAKFFFDPEPGFTLPHGIISSCEEGDYDANEIASGYMKHKDGEGKTTFEINVERDALLPLYERLLLVCESYRVFWYLLHDHWDDSTDHFLVNESLNSPELILSYLRSNKLDSLMNGHVTLTAYCEEGATNLNISDHKRIIIYTYSDKVAEEYVTVLGDAGYPEMDELVSIDCRMHHWHYRPSKSRSRNDLVKYLHSTGFKDWSPNK